MKGLVVTGDGGGAVSDVPQDLLLPRFSVTGKVARGSGCWFSLQDGSWKTSADIVEAGERQCAFHPHGDWRFVGWSHIVLLRVLVLLAS